jgi:acyl-coenzyme A synthetase/AMP-(fatty) acid ligase
VPRDGQNGAGAGAAVKTPKRIHVAESLPRSAVGKVLRREARRIFAGGA